MFTKTMNVTRCSVEKESEKYNKDKQYWIERFKTIPEVATIPGSIKGDIDETNPAGERKKYEIISDRGETVGCQRHCKSPSLQPKRERNPGRKRLCSDLGTGTSGYPC